MIKITSPADLRTLERIQNATYHRKVKAFNERKAAQQEQGELRSQIARMKKGPVNKHTRYRLNRLTQDLRWTSRKVARRRAAYKEADKKHEAAFARYNQAKEEAINLSLEERQSIARKAGIPTRYFGRMKFAVDSDRTIHIYYGGEGRPDGPGHGHAAAHQTGKPKFNRPPETVQFSHDNNLRVKR